MPPIPNWSEPMSLTSPGGNLEFNTDLANGGRYVVVPRKSHFDLDVRATKNNLPQFDGSALHHRFLTGAEMVLAIQLWEAAGGENSIPDNIACEDLLTEMLDDLSRSFRALLNAGDNQGRIAWEVAGANERMLDDIRLLVYPAEDLEGPVVEVIATVDSRYPYALDLTPQFVNGAAVITNNGTADTYPVYRVTGPTSSFTIANTTTDEQLVYSGTAIAGGHYAEIDTSRDTIYLDGSGADLLSEVDIINSLWPRLAIGANTITFSGSGTLVTEWQPAWG